MWCAIFEGTLYPVSAIEVPGTFTIGFQWAIKLTYILSDHVLLIFVGEQAPIDGPPILEQPLMEPFSHQALLLKEHNTLSMTNEYSLSLTRVANKILLLPAPTTQPYLISP